MKKFLTAFIIPAFIILFSCNNKPGNNGDAINLKFNLPTGSTYDYNIDMNMMMKGAVNGQSMNVNNKMAMGYMFSAKGDSAGWKKLTASISRIAMHVTGNGVNIDYDSDKSADTSDMVSGIMSKVLGAIKGGEFGFTMNEKGEVGSVTGVQDMMQRALSSIHTPNADAMASGMGNTFNEDNFKQNIQQSFGMYPDKPVKPGDTWTRTMNMNNQGMAMKIDNNYTLESVSGNTANVKVNSKISSPGGPMNIGGTMTGNMKFDIPTGLPTDGDLDMNMNMTMNNNGQSAPMNMDIQMKITGKKI